MHILFVVPYVPNLIRVRPYNLIRGLSARGHLVTVVTLWSDERERDDLDELGKICYRLYASPLPTWRSFYNALITLATRKPLQSRYSWQPALAERIGELLDHCNETPPFDVIHIEHLRGAEYGLGVKSRLEKAGVRLPIVWDSVDCISHLFKQSSLLSKRRMSRWLTGFELGRTRWYENWLVHQFDRVLVTSEIDRNALISLQSNGRDVSQISVLPNGVDLTYFEPDERVIRDDAALVVSGKMSYHANISMVLYLINEIMPLIWSHRPDIKLWLVGKDPSRDILNFSDHPAITVTGTVVDIRPYLRKAVIALAPTTYGTGIQNKVLEAMACGTPVVSTSKAVAALTVRPEHDLLVADEPEEFAGRILNLLDFPERRKQIGQAGRRYVEQNHNWQNISANLEDIYLAAIT
jgi:sugar transferase (PEP-CTERM/EpsH1 system associated)